MVIKTCAIVSPMINITHYFILKLIHISVSSCIVIAFVYYDSL